MFGFHPDKKAPPAPQPKLGFRPRGQQQSAALAQAQNQAPDSIPAMVKPGEFVLPPDTVHAMGGAGALQAAVDATHTPAAEEAWVPRGFKPKVFFANGGRPEDQIPTDGYPKAPLPDGSQDSVMNTDVGRNVSNLANAMPGALGGSLSVVGRTGGAISGAINSGSNAARGWASGAGLAGGAAALSTPVSASPVTPSAQAAPAPTQASAVSNSTSETGSTMGPPDAAAPSEVMPGVYRRGNSYADSAQAAALGDQPRGLPSWQNQNAANNLAGQQQTESMQRVQAAMAPPPTSPIQRVAIMGSGDARGFRRASHLRAADRGDLARLQEAQRYDTRLGFAAGQQQLERDRIAADTFRTARGFNVDQQRLDTERRLADSEITARGLKTRAQRQEEQLRNTFLDPNATPQQRQQAQQSLRAINGETEQSPWKVTVTPAIKNADGSTTQGSIIRHNGVTGEVQQVDGGMAAGPKTITNDDAGRRALAALPSGSVYVGPDGKQYRKA
ncbi:hypothetical protein [Delftia deserti]|uniref:Uncharacterized protein n=1 Tax=Delftia deserti TaxID=1651218 RepID=A0ABW5EXS9_9BURK